MAQTWPPKKWKRVLLGAIDFVGRPIARRVYTARPSCIPASPRILVVELWQIGDVVLVTPFLSALRECFPGASITLLGKPHAETLLRGSGLVDDVVIAELPWTRTRGKYGPAGYDRQTLRRLITALRARRFDLVFDARMDLRNNILISLVGVKRRVGFRYGGGDWLLTDAIPTDPAVNHKVRDWLSLAQAVGCEPAADPRCSLAVTQAEQAAARAILLNHFGSVHSIVALHPGGSHAGKRWPLELFVSLATDLAGAGHRVIALVDPSGYGREFSEIPDVLTLRLELRDMMAVIEQCATLVCNDSGPMHIAAALAVPTVAIFERGEPKWFGPVGDGHIVVTGEKSGVDVSAAPADRPPANPVSLDRVKQAVLVQLDRRRRGAHSDYFLRRKV